MANELDFQYSTSGLATIVAVLYNGAQIVKTSDGSLMTDSDANLPNAAIALADTGHLYRYVGSFPSGTPAGTYVARAYLKAGSNLARSDTAALKGESGEISWDGNAVGGGGGGSGDASQATLLSVLKVVQASSKK